MLRIAKYISSGIFLRMKLFIAAALLFAGLLTIAQAQQEADEKYLSIYELIRQADDLAEANQPAEALSAFTAAEGRLQQLRKIFPDWNPAIINFRLRYLEGKISGLKQQGVTLAAPVRNTEAAAPVVAGEPAPPTVNLNAQLQSLRAENEKLQAKLKESLAPQPTAVDPHSLAIAQEQIRGLMKENDLLKASHPAATPAPVPETIIVTDTNKLNQARLELVETARKLADEHARAEKLAAENSRLQQNLKADSSTDTLDALRNQNAKLQEQFETLRAAAVANAPEVAKLTAELKNTREQLASLKSTGATTSQKKSSSKNDTSAQINALNDELKTLRSRIAVNEAKTVPYTTEELALFRQPAPPASQTAPPRKSIKELPAGTAELVASAQRHFAKREFDQAEADYLKILERDPNNGLALANLATIELQQDKLPEAEKHIQAAVAQNPDDAYNLSTLGYLKFRQKKYDESLNALSRAANLDPENPEIQNYLGVTLSHKGLRTQGETALRKAIQLSPGFAPAHNNLAVIYLNQEPAAPQLARWHYQKALDAGQPRNPELEKMLADKGASVAAEAK